MSIGPNGYFDPNTTVSTLRVPASEQEQIVAAWERNLRLFEDQPSSRVPIPPIPQSYLPASWARNNGADLRHIKVKEILAGELDQQWWFQDHLGSDFWDKGDGLHNGFPQVAAPPIKHRSGPGPVVDTPAPVQQPSGPQRSAAPAPGTAPHRPASQATESKPATGLRAWWDRLNDEAQQKILISAVIVALIVGALVFG